MRSNAIISATARFAYLPAQRAGARIKNDIAQGRFAPVLSSLRCDYEMDSLHADAAILGMRSVCGIIKDIERRMEMAEIIDLNPYFEDEPDIQAMDAKQLCAYLKALKERIAEMDEREPKNMESEEYEDWAEAHEELEDAVDEILERMDELK